MTSTQDTLRLRPLRRDDIYVIETVFAGLSDRSRYLRFHSPVPRLSGPLWRSLLDVDGRDRLALVAETRAPDGQGIDRWRPVGIARLIRTSHVEAEIAVAVVDAWHRRGVGRALLTAVREAAETRGFDRLSALVLTENHAVQALIRSVFPQCVTRCDDDLLRLTCYLHADATAYLLDLVG